MTTEKGHGIKDVLNSVPTYHRFLPVREIDDIVDHITKKYDLSTREIGLTIEGEPLNVIEVGEGERTALVIGVPHSDEPLGSLVVIHLARWLAKHPDSKFFGWRWLFIPILERRGMRLNEGWFNAPLSFSTMAKSYFREPTEDQYEWTFPVTYQDYEWNKSRPETLAVKKLLENEKPDLLCGLHHCGFNDTYFYFSRDIPEAYKPLRDLASSLRMHLSEKAPDVPFGNMLSPGFYQMYGLKDYMDYYSEKDPTFLTMLRRGACSDEWYQKEIGGFSFNCEVPLYMSHLSRDQKTSNKSYKTLFENRYIREKNRVKYSENLLKRLEPCEEYADPHLLDSAKKHVINARAALEQQKRVLKGVGDRKASNQEVFDIDIMADMFDLFLLGQLWRTAESMCVRGGEKACRITDVVDIEIRSLAKKIEKQGSFYQLPIRTSVKMQVGSILQIARTL